VDDKVPSPNIGVRAAQLNRLVAMLTLTWADLFIEEPLLDVGRLLRLWPRTVGDVLRPIGMSAFGDIYFERPRGQVERLDVLEGGVHCVA